MKTLFEATTHAPAKINLGLHITGRREDGYHLLHTLMQTISLRDTVSLRVFSCADPVPPILLTVTGDPTLTDIPLDIRNTVYRIVQRYLERIKRPELKVHVQVEKRIPSQAGLGGASTDAAAALRLLNTHFSLPHNEILNLAAKIGADVPFFLYGGTCICEGIGEIVTPVSPLTPYTLLLIKAPVGISTPKAFQRFDERFPTGSGAETRIHSWDRQSSTLWDETPYLLNDLACIAIEDHPEIQHCIDFLRDNGAIHAAMSGSGTCVFGVFPREPDATAAAQKAKTNFPPDYFIQTATLIPGE